MHNPSEIHSPPQRPAGKNDGWMFLEEQTPPSATGEAQKAHFQEAVSRAGWDCSCALGALVPCIPIFPVGNESSREQPPAALQSFSMTSLEQQKHCHKAISRALYSPFPAKKQQVKLNPCQAKLHVYPLFQSNQNDKKLATCYLSNAKNTSC